MYHRFHLDTGTHSLQGHEKQAFSPDCLWQSSCNSKYIKEPLEESSISLSSLSPSSSLIKYSLNFLFLLLSVMLPWQKPNAGYIKSPSSLLLHISKGTELEKSTQLLYQSA